MTGKYSVIQLKNMVESIWREQGDRYQHYKFVDARNSDNIHVLCKMGHKWKTRLPALRLGKRCHDCYGAKKCSVIDITNRIEAFWANKPQFIGYKLIRVHFLQGHWNYIYTCSANHERDVMLLNPPGSVLYSCSHSDHPSYQTKPEHEYRQAILDHWLADPRIWGGYKLLSLGQYTAITTQIECANGHLTAVAPYRVLKYNAGCSHRDCVTLRQFQNGSAYKHLDYAGKQFKYQGYEDRLLKILFQRFISDTIDTNAMLYKPVSFTYLDGNQIHHYFPDIRVHSPAYSRWYEVKSTYTYDYNGNDDDLRATNHAKWKSASAKTGEVFDAFIWSHLTNKRKKFNRNGCALLCYNGA